MLHVELCIKPYVELRTELYVELCVELHAELYYVKPLYSLPK